MADMVPISDEYAADLVAKLQDEAARGRTDEFFQHIQVRDMLILKLWAKVQAMEAATGFLGGGIKPIGRSP